MKHVVEAVLPRLRRGADPAGRRASALCSRLSRATTLTSSISAPARSMVAGHDEQVVDVGARWSPRRRAAAPSTSSVVGRRDAAVVLDAQRRGGVALRVEVDDQDPLPELGERGGDVDGRRGLADPALLVGDHDHPGRAPGAAAPAACRAPCRASSDVLGGPGEGGGLVVVRSASGGSTSREVRPRSARRTLRDVSRETSARHRCSRTHRSRPACGELGAACGEPRSAGRVGPVDNSSAGSPVAAGACAVDAHASASAVRPLGRRRRRPTLPAPDRRGPPGPPVVVDRPRPRTAELEHLGRGAPQPAQRRRRPPRSPRSTERPFIATSAPVGRHQRHRPVQQPVQRSHRPRR